jgi:hypothetical protein
MSGINSIIIIMLLKQYTVFFCPSCYLCPLCISVVFVLDYLFSSVVVFLLLASWLFIRHVNKNNCGELNDCHQLVYGAIILTCTRDPNFILARLLHEDVKG